MKIRSNHLLNFTNIAAKVLTITLLIIFGISAFKSNNYEVLFIDERMLVDDIYNIWLLDDVFNRFDEVDNILFKNLLIFFIEFAYGGDLRYGRLWSNFFVIFAGPIMFFGDVALITFSRILNISLFFIGNFLLVRYLVKKEYQWIALLAIYSLPSVEYFHRIPKPDTFLILFVALGIKFIIKEEYNKAVFFLAIASFIKINTVVLFGFLGIYILFNLKENKVSFILRSFLISIAALFIVNPILIIPPIKFGSYSLPNFYQIYFQWITSQGSNGEDISLLLSTPEKWLTTLAKFYKLSPSFNLLFLILFMLFTFSGIYIVAKNKDQLSATLIFVSLLYLLFYFLFIERQYTHYLHLPLTLLLLSIFKNLEISKINYFGKVMTFVFLTFVLLGAFSNYERFVAEKTFNANDRYGYTNIDNEIDAIMLVDKIIEEINDIYENNEDLNKNLVYWHPDLFVPRNGITYNELFFVREYWGSKDRPSDALIESDIFVTYTDYENYESESIEKKRIQNIFLYFKK